MKLFELDSDDLEGANYDPNTDKVNNRSKGEIRKTDLFLKDVNRLKKIRAMRQLADLKRDDLIGVMYSGGDDAAGGDGGFGGGFA